MLAAYILVETSVGTIAHVVDGLKAFEEVQYAYRVTGPYDVIAKVETADPKGLSRLLHDRVDSVEGVVKTITCVVVP